MDILVFCAYFLDDVPCYRLAFPVGVGSEKNIVHVFRKLFKLRDHLRFLFYDLIGGLKTIFYIYSKFTFWKILHMSYRCLDLKVGAKVLFYRFDLSR